MTNSYSFPKGVADGFQVELENGVTYEFNAEFKRWDVVKGTGSSVWITDELPDGNYVSNGDLWFDNTADTMQLFLWHEESGAWLPVAPSTKLEGRVDDLADRITAGETEQTNISKRVDELSVTKGSVARYVVTGTSINVASRNGELYLNSATAADVEFISFAPFDSNGQATKPCNKDDIVEFVEAAGGKYAGDITRYKVVSGDSNALTVQYLSGDNNFEVGETEEVYVYPQNSDLASVDYVDAQDEALQEQIDLKMSRTGTQRLASDNFWRLKQVTPEGNEQTYLSISNAEIRLYHVAEPTADDHATTKKYVDDLINAIPEADLSGYATEQFVTDAIDAIPETDLSGYATEQYVTDAIDAIPETDLSEYFKKSGGTLTGAVHINRGNKPGPQLRISPNSTNYATNIYAMQNGELRLRSSSTDAEDDHVGSHIVIQANDDAPTTKIYHVPEPTQPHMVASKEYVDNKVASTGGGVPVGCIMIWMNSVAPDGWLKLQGQSFDVNEYPELHAYLQGTDGYTSGKLPNWGGHYPGEYGGHITDSLGKKVGYMTARPAGEAPYHANAIPNGNARGFNGAGGTNAYSDGVARPAITEGWDSTTRPNTVIVHHIIRAKP